MPRTTKVDCFAYVDGGCRALTRTSCEGCHFYKTEKQNNEEQKTIAKRLSKKYGVSYDLLMLQKGYKK